MAKSLIYVVNSGAQAVAADGVVSLGTVVRRYGCNLNLSGNGVEVRGAGYYTFNCNIVAEPAATGSITATLMKDGVPIPGASATANAATADVPVTLPIIGVIREGCGCADSASTITCVLSADANVTNAVLLGERA